MSSPFDLNSVCEKLIGINLTGNIVPVQWFQHIIKTNGKSDMLAINILADVIYWYRPAEVRDEATGHVTGFKQKFKADKLQKTYNNYAEMFGVSKKQVRESFNTLERLNLVIIEFRNITTEHGLVLTNVMYIEPVFDEVMKISNEIRYCPNGKEVIPKKEIGYAETGKRSFPKRNDVYKDYLENTTETTTTTTAVAAAVPVKNVPPVSPADTIKDLVKLIPPEVSKPSVEALLKKHFDQGQSFEYLKDQILYTNHTSDYRTSGGKSPWMRYKAYLGKSLDFGYGTGFSADIEHKQPDKQSDKQPDKPVIMDGLVEFNGDICKLRSGVIYTKKGVIPFAETKELLNSGKAKLLDNNKGVN